MIISASWHAKDVKPTIFVWDKEESEVIEDMVSDGHEVYEIMKSIEDVEKFQERHHDVDELFSILDCLHDFGVDI